MFWGGEVFVAIIRHSRESKQRVYGDMHHFEQHVRRDMVHVLRREWLP